ncbi:MAG TPA: endonuclease/exonuclease/phosphatase family protein [Blastocatellia bacterium]|nr:endonuclease/exonuclease/phosphatase family protein [Blastocatellia bacterium]
MRIRVVTYNIHRCRGLDRRVRPARIVDVLREMDADIIALQEVVSLRGGAREKDQARFISEEMGMTCAVGGTRIHNGGIYGNVVLTRLPLVESRNYDISVHGREQRGCMRADISANGSGLLHVFNVHLGTAFIERRHQGRKLVNNAILNNEELSGARILVGDFNEWTRGLTTRLLATHLTSADIRTHLLRSRTYPGVLPLLHLDHVYFDNSLELEAMTLHKSRTAIVASDHLPLIADFRVEAD